MAKTKRKTGLVEAFRKAASRDARPHLDPINAVSFAADSGVALGKAGNLLAYQTYLAAARATKAKRKGTSASFERSVLAEAQKARDDLETFSVAALRLQRQVNQTGMWERSLTHLSTTLRESGPVDIKTMWSEIAGNAQYRSALAERGVSAEMTAAVTQAFATLDATAVLRGGKVSVETRVAGESRPRRLELRSGPSRPANLSDLLRRSQFDRVVSAIENKEAVYLEAVAGTGIASYEPGDLFAFGAVAARQRMTEHVRKLEDTGLATYEGNDPFTFLATLLIVGLVLGILGAAILSTCDENNPVTSPDWLCSVGALMVVLAAIALGGLMLIFFAEGALICFIGFVALLLLVPALIEAFDELTSFEVSGTPA